MDASKIMLELNEPKALATKGLPSLMLPARWILCANSHFTSTTSIRTLPVTRVTGSSGASV